MPVPRTPFATAALALLLACAMPQAHAQPRPERPVTISGYATVIDGQTLQIRGTRIRLFGLEQPSDDHVCVRTDDERWRCGPRALNALEEYLEESVVSCVVGERDAAGEVVAVCTTSGIDLSLWLIRNGLALAGSGASSRYRQAQDDAKAGRKGMWLDGAVESVR